MQFHCSLRVDLSQGTLIPRHIERAIRFSELQGQVLNLLATLHLRLLILHLGLLELHLLLLVAILHKLLTALLGRLDAAEKAARKRSHRTALTRVDSGEGL